MKRFILGVGSQKAGTTWLHEYMASFDQVGKGPLKEYHVWDALHLSICKRFKAKKRQATRSPAKLIRRRMQKKDGFYFDFFEDLLKTPGVQIAHDITPSYSGLGREVLRDIRQRFESRGVECRAVFLMRDPVERCLSSFKMRASAKGKDFSSVDPVVYAMSGGSTLRTRYDKTIEELNASFDPSSIYLGLFEEMFLPEKIAAISEFIGVSPKPERSGTKVNASRSDASFSDDTRALIADQYRGVYEYMADLMPKTKHLWPGFKYL